MSIDERIIKLEEFSADVRRYTQILTEMIRRHDERLDEHEPRLDSHVEQLTKLRAVHVEQMAEIRAAHAETERAIAALADAQIRTEDNVNRLSEKIDRLTEGRDGVS